ncbi:class I histocompatibility antigen, F10 alpha chain-like [Pristis pectinata]|uniref:class I histocompatibility antigen, F10 alpha chain-like n=1 Tax=Pristis pectinata TaxID=685728 RepID=UPI00223D1506|nr:class I histocompatibility antigen, F10 alpha chain-like [Pristis pectinata]
MFPLMLLSFYGVQAVLDEPHTLVYYYTLNHGNDDLPEYIVVGVLDGCVIHYYDKKMEKAVPRQEWMANSFDKTYWTSIAVTLSPFHVIIKGQLDGWLREVNETANYHYVQGQFGCEVKDARANALILKLAFDGEYILSFDNEKLDWIAHCPEAQFLKERWDDNEKMNQRFKNLLEMNCVDLWKRYHSIGNAYLTRKITPEVIVAARPGEHWFLHCYVFGFYPTAINVSWFRNGQHVSETKSTGILPNEDGTYQLRSILEFDPFDGKEYSCRIDHSSLPGGKTVIWEGNQMKQRYIALIAVFVLISLVIIFTVIIWWRKKDVGLREVIGCCKLSTSPRIYPGPSA